MDLREKSLDGAAGRANGAGEGKGGYASVNGLNMYYEMHGPEPGGDTTPLVLLHGALTTIDTSFGDMLPLFARTRPVIAVEQQAHGRTADIDRPLSYEQMAEDTAALLRQLNIRQADFFGYSMGSGLALLIAARHPDLVRKLVLASLAYNREGVHPGIFDGIEDLKPEHLAGTPWEAAYAQTAPNPENWPVLIEKNKQLDIGFEGWSAETIQQIDAPTMIVIGDSDIVRPEHAVEMFRLFGGGVAGDIVGLPKSRLAVLPGTTHVTLVERAAWLVPMIEEFLDFQLAGSK